MTPVPNDRAGVQYDTIPLNGDSVVISGMAGLYPQCHSVKELAEVLYNGVDPITTGVSRWPDFSHPELPEHTGIIPELDKFDAQFFKVHYRLGNNMDAMSRKVLEQAYQAIYDAGVSPEQLSTSNLGVFVGCCFSESEKSAFYATCSKTGLGIAGSSKTMFANRISYWLNARGPSMTMDGGCCSSFATLEQAHAAITRGDCDSAIVAGVNLCLHPQSSVLYSRVINMCHDGKTKSFDQKADGCVRSEAINVLFLQKAKDALRIYANVLHVKTEFRPVDKTGRKYGYERNPKDTVAFLKNFYEEANFPPQAVEYVEAFGSATPAADKAELEAISEIFCEERSKPLLVGSVMSNIGYCEAASGICALTKILLGYERGELAANLHCKNPRNDIVALQDGRMQIVTDHQAFRRSYTAVNGTSFAGINAHVLLHGHYKPKDLQRYKSSIPHLVTISGRQESAVKKILDDLKTRPIDPEELVLLHKIHESRINGHMGRGYAILDTKNQETEVLRNKIDYFDDAQRPLWFVYSGMGSQWAGMGAELMRFPIFAAAIERCRKVLEPKGIDIVKILTEPDNKIYDNILNSFVGIAAVQIGLTDILREIGLVPDKLIGHSVGELGCGYADGCFTTEEMILSAYSRGLVSLNTPLIKGAMSAVGLGYQQVVKLCPPGVDVACHNSSESCTISGPADVMKEFITNLTEQGIFAKEVPCSNIAYHSRYMADAGPKLLEYLSEVIKSPKPRSDRWVSSSIPQDRWTEGNAKYCSAWYHTNNLLSPVLFEESSKLIPPNAVVVEIAPHGLLQAILKRSLPSTCRNIPLTKRKHPDNAVFLLEAIGNLYLEGYNPKIKNIYPKVEFPVSTGTPMLSHLVEWAHGETWRLPLYVCAAKKTAAICKFVITYHDDENKYLQGNVIRGKTEYPFAAALVAVWDILAMVQGVPKKQIPIQFRDLHLFTQPILHDIRPLQLTIALHRGTGEFEVRDAFSNVITGFASSTIDASNSVEIFDKIEKLDLTTDDVYQILQESEYSYTGAFQSIQKTNSSFTEAQIAWDDNWVTVLDGIFQLNVLKKGQDTVLQPNHVGIISIDINHDSIVNDNGRRYMVAKLSEVHGYTRCGGVFVKNIKFTQLPASIKSSLKIKTLEFIPRFQSNTLDAVTILKVYMQIVAENVNEDVIRVVGVLDQNEYFFNEIQSLLDDVPGVRVTFEQINKNKAVDKEKLKAHVIIVKNIGQDDNLRQTLHRNLAPDTFIINGGDDSEVNRVLPSSLFRVVCGHSAGRTRLELAKWRPSQTPISTALTVRKRADLATLSMTRTCMPIGHKLLVLATYPPVPGLKDLIKQWRRESERNQVYLVMVSGTENLDQLPDLDLAFNILDNCVWGGEYYIGWKEKATSEQGATLQSSQVGDLNSLHWIETPEPTGSGVIVTVRYAGINDSDVKRATGVIPLKTQESHSYGMDFSGTTESGERVMGIVPSGSASTKVRALPDLLWPVPSHWTLEDAATVPSAYAYAFYCLGIKAQLYPGMTVLVHGGSGALGQAAISIALAIGCEVFATVSSTKKKHFIRKLFPELKDNHIGNSRDDTFGDMVLRATNGKGCDVIISCVKGEQKNTTLNCAAFCGITLDTVQALREENYSYGMFYMTRQRSYMPVDFSTVFDYKEDMEMLQTMLSEGIASGYVRPLSRVTYAPTEASRAFRLLAASRHRGRVLLSLRDSVFASKSRMTCSPDLSHLIICDDEGLGLQLANRMVSRGVRKLRLNISNLSNQAKLKIQTWISLGVTVNTSSEDIGNTKIVASLLKDCIRMGPIEGIYFVTSEFAGDKDIDVAASFITELDAVSRKLCPSLKYFAIISNVDSLGRQTCRVRVQELLPATILHLPAFKKSIAQGLVSWASVLNAAEKALCSKESVLIAHPRPSNKDQSLLQKLASIADLKLPNNLNENTTLKDLGLDCSKSQIVCTYLSNVQNLALEESDLNSMTVKKLQEIEEMTSSFNFKDKKGLSTFFSCVDSDELLATVDTVFMSTIAKQLNIGENEIDVKQNRLCIIPGMEGNHGRFKELCQRLKLAAMVLQEGLDGGIETLQQTAQRYIQIMQKKMKPRNNFYLLGYETGVLTALEMLSILEDQGLTGTLFCIGGAPQALQDYLKQKLEEYETEEQLQDALIRHFSTLIANDSMTELEDALKTATSWKAKIEACIPILLGRVPHSGQHIINLIEAAYAKIVQTREYKPKPRKLRSRLVLLRPSDLKSSDGLEEYSQQPVTVYDLRAPLAFSTQDPRCTAIINHHLDEEILTQFEALNICVPYIINADTLMVKAKFS